jgi:hypothetical protein
MSVDALLRGRSHRPEIRYRDESGQIQIEEAAAEQRVERIEERPLRADTLRRRSPTKALRIYGYGVGKNRLRQAAKNLHLPVTLVESVREADVVITLKNYFRRRPQPIASAERHGVPIHVLRSNTVHQMETCLADMFGLDVAELDPLAIAMRETDAGIRRVLEGEKSVDLSSQNSYIRRLQHEMVRQANLVSHSYGREPMRHVRVFGTQRN